MFQIQLTEPFVARDVRAFSVYPSENEVILPPNVSFEVVSVFDAGNGLHIVQYKQTESLDDILDLTYEGWLAPGKKVRIDQAALMAQHDDRIKRWLQGVEEAEVVRQMSDGRWAIQVAGRKQETWVPESILRSGDDGGAAPQDRPRRRWRTYAGFIFLYIFIPYWLYG